MLDPGVFFRDPNKEWTGHPRLNDKPGRHLGRLTWTWRDNQVDRGHLVAKYLLNPEICHFSWASFDARPLQFRQPAEVPGVGTVFRPRTYGVIRTRGSTSCINGALPGSDIIGFV
jgi:hypothetical protein